MLFQLKNIVSIFITFVLLFNFILCAMFHLSKNINISSPLFIESEWPDNQEREQTLKIFLTQAVNLSYGCDDFKSVLAKDPNGVLIMACNIVNVYLLNQTVLENYWHREFLDYISLQYLPGFHKKNSCRIFRKSWFPFYGFYCSN